MNDQPQPDVGTALLTMMSAAGGAVPQMFFFDGAGTLFLIEEDRDGIGEMTDEQLKAFTAMVRYAMTRTVQLREERADDV